MKCHVFKRKREVNGKLRVSEYYCGRYRLPDDVQDTEIALGTKDKQVAETKLRRIVGELERGREGMSIPKKMREAMATPLMEHVKAFVSELRSKRCHRHVANVQMHLERLSDACGWKTLRDVTAESFRVWRQREKGRKSEKTLNEYLGSVRHFLNWLEDNEQLERNPLKGIDKIPVLTRKVERRSLRIEDARRLLEVAGPVRRVVYLLCMTTGLRREELKQLEWRDVRLDASVPFIAVRAATAKNRKNAQQPLHPEAAEALKQLRPATASEMDKVFPKCVPKMPRMRKDLKAAGIPFVDEAGKRLDLHALRKTFQMLLTLNGTHLRTTQALMRHSTSKLTESTYTDEGLLPTADAIHALPSLLNSAKHDTPQDTPESTLLPVAERSRVSRSVAGDEKCKPAGTLINRRIQPDSAPSVATCHEWKMVGATGFEPATSWSQTKRSTKLSYAPTLLKPALANAAAGTSSLAANYARRHEPGKEISLHGNRHGRRCHLGCLDACAGRPAVSLARSSSDFSSGNSFRVSAAARNPAAFAPSPEAVRNTAW